MIIMAFDIVDCLIWLSSILCDYTLVLDPADNPSLHLLFEAAS